MTQNNLSKQLNYWLESAERNFETAQSLFNLKHYDACLFFCHLSIEKILKGLIVKRIKRTPAYTHDLERLALFAKIPLTDTQSKHLKEITGFNIAGRYDDVKLSFYKKCTKQYAGEYLLISQNLYLWLKKQYQKK